MMHIPSRPLESVEEVPEMPMFSSLCTNHDALEDYVLALPDFGSSYNDDCSAASCALSTGDSWLQPKLSDNTFAGLSQPSMSSSSGGGGVNLTGLATPQRRKRRASSVMSDLFDEMFKEAHTMGGCASNSTSNNAPRRQSTMDLESILNSPEVRLDVDADAAAAVPSTTERNDADSSSVFASTIPEHPLVVPMSPPRSNNNSNNISSTSSSSDGPAWFDIASSSCPPLSLPPCSPTRSVPSISPGSVSPGSPMFLSDSLYQRSSSAVSVASTASSIASVPSPSPVSPMSSPTRRRKRTCGASTSPKHAAERNHVCSLCASRFLCKSKLDRHMLTHTGARPFGCYCGKRFNQKSALKNHTRRHLKRGDTPAGANIELNGLNGFTYAALMSHPVPS